MRQRETPCSGNLVYVNELAARLGSVTNVIQRSLRKLETDNLIKATRQQILSIDREDSEKLAALTACR